MSNTNPRPRPTRGLAAAALAIASAVGCARDGDTAPAAPAPGPATATRPATAPSIWTSKTPIEWQGRPVTSYPVTTDTTKLTDLWEEVPPGSKSYEYRKGVRAVRSKRDIFTTIYLLPGGDRFYVESSPAGSSQHHFYGPFEGDPAPLIGERAE